MSLTYGLLALALVIAALVVTAFALLGVSEWVRWLVAHGAAIAALALVLTGATMLNTVIPRGCDADGVPTERRPITAALTGVGSCHRQGVAQVALVPLAGVAGSLVAVLLGRRHGDPSRDEDDGTGHAGHGPGNRRSGVPTVTGTP